VLRIVPITQRAARAYIDANHRHNRPPRGDFFRVAVIDDGGAIRGVGQAGRPVARELQDGTTVEITRVGTDGVRNGCSIMYGALCRAAKALGYRRAYTYTLAGEPGSSLRAAGFVEDATLPPRPTWDTPSRRRQQADEHGDKRPPGAKVRWVRILAD